MTQTSKPISPLGQRKLDDLRMRKLSEKTQSHYIRAVVNFTRFLWRAPDTATAEDLRRYQLHLVETGISRIRLNATITALRFFFGVTLERPEALPVVLSRKEVARLIAAAANPKYQAALAVAYGAGLRASEVVALKVGDIDSTRMTLRIEQGKGRKDRYALLCPALLGQLPRAPPGMRPSAASRIHDVIHPVWGEPSL